MVPAEQVESYIVRMLDDADQRKLEIIYHFVLHITARPKGHREGGAG